jgi:hypothetical protein
MDYFPSIRPPWRRAWLLLLVGSSLTGWAGDVAAEKILSPAELATMERENGMWRLVRPEEEVPANLARLAKAGFTASEVASLQLRLAAWWDVPLERNFGWLHQETVGQIQEIDRQFVVRMRAVRLFEGTGIRRSGETASVGDLTRLWRSAILKVLEFDELAEFRLMNSASAQALGLLVKDLPVSEDELRTLFEWQREFTGTHGAAAPAVAKQPVWQREEQLGQWHRIRELLGDGRFAIYLGRASPVFDRMQQALERAGGASPTVALDLWWLRQRDGWARDQEFLGNRRNELTAQMKTKAVALLGEGPASKYIQDEDGRWLTIPQRARRRATEPAPAKP